MSEISDDIPEQHPFNAAIARAGVKDECPRCEATAWQVLEGDYAFVKTLTDPTQTGDGPGIPCAVAVCTRCGFVAMHAIGVLDL